MLGVILPQTTFAADNSVQQREVISGVITDANTQESIVGASVMVKGTSMGAVTDIDGKYTLTVEKFPVTLVVSYVGYQKKEIKMTSGGANHNSVFSDDSQMME